MSLFQSTNSWYQRVDFRGSTRGTYVQIAFDTWTFGGPREWMVYMKLPWFHGNRPGWRFHVLRLRKFSRGSTCLFQSAMIPEIIFDKESKLWSSLLNDIKIRWHSYSWPLELQPVVLPMCEWCTFKGPFSRIPDLITIWKSSTWSLVTCNRPQNYVKNYFRLSTFYGFPWYQEGLWLCWSTYPLVSPSEDEH